MKKLTYDEFHLIAVDGNSIKVVSPDRGSKFERMFGKIQDKQFNVIESTDVLDADEKNSNFSFSVYYDFKRPFASVRSANISPRGSFKKVISQNIPPSKNIIISSLNHQMKE
jgi:hypothetical protein